MSSSVALPNPGVHLPRLPALKDFIKMYRLDSKKTLSQNYLMDMNLTRKIVRKSGDIRDAYVLEIGPGPGGITRAILEQPCRRLDVVELDRQFMMPLEHLRDFSKGRMNIHQGDILRTDISSIWEVAHAPRWNWLDKNPPFRIIGNLPFHISTPLIIKLLNGIATRTGPFAFARCPMTFTFQHEVAQRIVAPLETDDRSRIGLACQNWTEPKIMFRVPGKCFTPRPDIDVSVVHFVPRVEPQIPCSFELSMKMFRHLYHFKRKYLIRAIESLYPKEMANKMANDLLRYCRIDPTLRVASLGMEDLADMCLFYERQCREVPGLFLYSHSNPRRLGVLAAHRNPFPPSYVKPTEALDQIDHSGLTLNEFGRELARRELNNGKEEIKEIIEEEEDWSELAKDFEEEEEDLEKG